MVCHSLLQWTSFCQTFLPWPARLGWPHRAWLSFIELDKAVVRVIRLPSFLWLWFQCVCSLMPSRNTYHLTWVSLWPPHVKSWLIGKDSDAGRDWGQEEKGMTEDEMAGWHHRLEGREFEWTPGVGDGQGGLVCCNSWGCKELDTTERLNWARHVNLPFQL